MKIRKKLDDSKCCATRCKAPPEEAHTDPGGNVLWYCERHARESREGAAYHHVELIVERIAESPTLPEPEILSAEAMAARDAIEADKAKADGAIARLFAADNVAKMADLKRQAEADLADLGDLEIDAETIPFAEGERDTLRAARRELESQRTKVTKPLNAVLRSINGWYKPVDSALGALEGAWTRAINDQMARAQAEKLRLLEAAQRAAAEADRAETPEARENSAEETRAALVAAAEAVPETSTVFIDRWRYEITDADALPREYLCPDERKIAAVVKSLGEQTQISGVRVWNDPIQRKR